MRKRFSFILLIFSISSLSFTQQKDKAEPQLDVKQNIQREFEAQYGKGWHLTGT